VKFVPIGHPAGARVEPLEIEVRIAGGVPLRATGEIYPHQLEPLQGNRHTVALLVLDEPAATVKRIAVKVLELVRPMLPRGRWRVWLDPGDERIQELTFKRSLGEEKLGNELRERLLHSEHRIVAEHSTTWDLDEGSCLEVVSAPSWALSACVSTVPTSLLTPW